MNLYLLERWPPGDCAYEGMTGAVVAATRADLARKLAAQKAGTEGREVWLDPQRSTCKLITPRSGGVILRATA